MMDSKHSMNKQRDKYLEQFKIAEKIIKNHNRTQKELDMIYIIIVITSILLLLGLFGK